MEQNGDDGALRAQARSRDGQVLEGDALCLEPPAAGKEPPQRPRGDYAEGDGYGGTATAAKRRRVDHRRQLRRGDDRPHRSDQLLPRQLGAHGHLLRHGRIEEGRGRRGRKEDIIITITGPTNHESYDYGNNRRAGEGKFKGVTVLFTPIHILLADRGDGKGNMKRRRALARAAVASRATDADPKFTTPTITTRIMMSMSNVTINIVIRDNRAS